MPAKSNLRSISPIVTAIGTRQVAMSLQLDISYLAAQIAGLFAMACLAGWPLLKNRPAILLAQLGIGLGFALHFALLGVWAASAVSLLGTVQTVAACFAAQSKMAARAGYALIPATILAGIWFWTGPAAALAVLATILAALGRMQLDQTGLRVLLLAGSAVWAIHDLAIGSQIAFAADVMSLVMGVAKLLNLKFNFRAARVSEVRF
jgi:hypothetical protein